MDVVTIGTVFFASAIAASLYALPFYLAPLSKGAERRALWFLPLPLVILALSFARDPLVNAVAMLAVMAVWWALRNALRNKA